MIIFSVADFVMATERLSFLRSIAVYSDERCGCRFDNNNNNNNNNNYNNNGYYPYYNYNYFHFSKYSQ